MTVDGDRRTAAVTRAGSRVGGQAGAPGQAGDAGHRRAPAASAGAATAGGARREPAAELAADHRAERPPAAERNGATAADRDSELSRASLCRP